MKASESIQKYIGHQMKEHKTTYDPNHCRDFIDLYLQLVNEEYKTKPPFDGRFEFFFTLKMSFLTIAYHSRHISPY